MVARVRFVGIVVTLALIAGVWELARAQNGDVPAPKQFVTHHEVRVGGATIKYTAIAGETHLTNLAGDAIGSLFSFTYLKDGPPDPSRPIMFVFNGGPGSSSIWLHMGIVGPRRVVLDREVNPSNVPPFSFASNPHTVLDTTDLVFVDPIGTGFSRVIGKGKPEDFYGVDEDADAIAQFIERWLTKHGRWTSPKFVMGESYGSMRAAVLPRALMGGPVYIGLMRGITLNGIVLLGTTLRARDEGPGGESAEMTSVLSLPTMAATAWYHNKVDRRGRSLVEFNDEVTRFATTEYLAALEKIPANTLTSADRGAIVEKLASYTGLPSSAFEKDLRVSPQQFSRQLLADRGMAVGMYDGRYTLPSANSLGDPVADDAAMGRYVPGFIAAFQQMLRDDLKVDLDRPYYAITWRDLLSKWNWKRAGVPAGQSLAVDLVGAMRRNEKLRVLVASGYYDLVTTHTAARHQLTEAKPPSDRVVYKTYESGHMLYLGDTAEVFGNAVRELIRSALR